MSHIFLTSQVNAVAQSIADKIPSLETKKLAYITTASEQSHELAWRDKNRQALLDAGFTIEDYTITHKTAGQVKGELDVFDILFMEGGDSFYLLEQIQQTDCKEVLRELIRDKIYIGCSAGSIVAGPDIYPARRLSTATFPQLKETKGLEIVDILVLPHWGAGFRRQIWLEGESGSDGRIFHNYDTNLKRVLLADDQYLEFKDGWFKFCNA